MIEYDKLTGYNGVNFLTYLFDKNGLLGLFTQNRWDSDEYSLETDLYAMFLEDNEATYKSVPLNQLTSNVWEDLDAWCHIAYEQVETYYTKLHNLGKTDDEIAEIAAKIDKSNFITEIYRGLKECSFQEINQWIENGHKK